MAKVRVQKLALVSELASKLWTLRGHKKPPQIFNLYISFLEGFRTTPVGSDREISLDVSSDPGQMLMISG